MYGAHLCVFVCVCGWGGVPLRSPYPNRSGPANGLPGTPPTGLPCTWGSGTAGRVSIDGLDPLQSLWGHTPPRSGSFTRNRFGMPYSPSFPRWCAAQPDQTDL